MDLSVPAPAAKLLDLIGSIEAPKGYNTVFGNNQSKLPKPLTAMTIDEVIAAGASWTKRFRSSACGRYQFMRDTLRGLKTSEHLSGANLLDEGMQDRLGFALMRRRGYDKFIAGKMSITAFGLALAQEWASFPVLKPCKGAHRQVARGETYYAGDRLNRSLVEPERVEAALASALAMAGASGQVAPVLIAMPAGAPAAPASGILDRLRSWWAPAPALPPQAAKKGDPGIYDIQGMLLDRGYTELGEHDGIEGPKLHAAAANFRRDNGLPPVADGGELDAALRAALPGAPHRPVAAARIEATADTLRREGNPVVEQFDGIKKIGAVVAGFAGVGATDQAGLVEGIKTTVEQAQSIVTSVQSAIVTTMNIIQWSVRHWWLFILVFVLWQIAKALGGVSLQVLSYRLGNIQRAGS